MEIPIIYKDQDIIVINKPAGVAVHKKSASDTQETVADILLRQFPELKSVGNDPLRPGIVHRLDKYTSGVMIVARNKETYEFLTSQFRKGLVEKEYTALLEGHLPLKKGTIESPIGSLGLKKTSRQKTNSAVGLWREARTDYVVRKYYKAYTLVEAFPKTGRTHQIRVHFQSLGHPVVCDKLYGKKNTICPAGLKRMFLHAYAISFQMPPNKRVQFGADLPEDLAKTLEDLAKEETVSV